MAESTESLQKLLGSLLRNSRTSLLAILLGVVVIILLGNTSFLNAISLPKWLTKWLYLVGAGLILFPLLAAFLDGLVLKAKVRKLRKTYPRDALNKSIHLLHFNGPIYIIDERTHTMHWIKTWRTLADLGFESDWVNAPNVDLRNMPNRSGVMVATISGKQLNLGDFRNEPPIFTQDSDLITQ